MNSTLSGEAVAARAQGRQASVRIGCASGFWGDSRLGAPQLVASGEIDYLVFDYLAETTMAILAAARARHPEAGYATDFVDVALKDVLAPALDQGIRIVANAGGINPAGCAQAVRALADSLGLKPRIAVVLGDDVSAMMPALCDEGVLDMETLVPVPARVASANAYLGAYPIARALAEGAQIVITGRGVDSAVTLGALIHEFGWSPADYDRLAAGSLAGHIIECACQATGGLFTDWEDVPDWPGIGYPIVTVDADGRFTVSKPSGTGGLISRAAVCEQLLYEIGDPQSYVLPDVVCDFTQVTITPLDTGHVRVEGARGRAPTSTLKVLATRPDGYRCAAMLVIIGIDAARKARRTGESILARMRTFLAQRDIPDFTRTAIELFGCEHLYGPHARTSASREVMVRVVVDHPSKEVLEVFAREVAAAGTSWSPGTTMPAGGRPSPSPLIKPFSFLLEKSRVSVSVTIDGVVIELPAWHCETSEPCSEPMDPAFAPAPDGPTREVPLVELAWARSGDKGDRSNIGVIARDARWLPILWHALTPEVVQAYFAHLGVSRVRRYALPGIAALNLVLENALAGGGPASPRFDPLGKGMAQMLLDIRVAVPTTRVTKETPTGPAMASAPPAP